MLIMDERIALARKALSHFNNVEVLEEGNTTIWLTSSKDRDADAVLRGLRAVSDFEYEFQLANMNRALSPEIESIFLNAFRKIILHLIFFSQRNRLTWWRH